MKMKRILAAALALVLCLSLSVTAFAATDDTAGPEGCDISLTVDDTGGELSVRLEAYASVTDGVVTITYDSAKLSIEAEDVTAAAAVDMDSVNASEAGILKISWLSAEAADGTLFDLGFSVKEGAELDGNSFSIDGLVVDENNNEASLGMLSTLPAAEETPAEGGSETPSEGESEGSSEDESEGGSGSGSAGGSDGSSAGGAAGSSSGETGDAEGTGGAGSAQTGDQMPVLMMSITAVAALAVIAVLLFRRRTVKK